MWKNNRMRYMMSAVVCGAIACTGALAMPVEEVTAEDTQVMDSVPATDESGVLITVNPQQSTQSVTLENGNYQIVSVVDQTVLSTHGRGGGEKAAIVCRANQSLTVQTYGVKQAENGSITLKSRTAKGKLLSSTSDGLVQTAQGTTESTSFAVIEEADGTVSIRLVSDLMQALTNQNGRAVMTVYTGADTQKWSLQKNEQLHTKTLESGVYTIDNVKRGTSMKVSGGQSIVMDSKSVSESEKFYVKYVGNGEYTITSFAGNGKKVGTAAAAGSKLKLGNSTRYYIDKKWSGAYSIVRAGTNYTAVSARSSNVKTVRYSGAKTEIWTFDSKVKEDTAVASQRLEAVMKKYPSGKYLGSGYSFAGGSQCMGFGREVFYRMFGKETRWNYDGSAKSSGYAQNYTVEARSSSYSAKSIKKLIGKAKPGDVLQMNAPKIHTMIFVSSDSSGFTVYDANWVGSNQVSVRHVSYSAWSSRNSSGISLLHSTNYPAT